MQAATQISLVPQRNMDALAAAMREARDAGIPLSSIGKDAGVSRPLISNLVNHGAAPISQECQNSLWAWYDNWQGNRAGALEDARQAGSYKLTPEIIRTESFLAALGHCDMYIRNRWLGVIVGMPGIGKTTVARHIKAAYPRVIYVEARTSMRLGDLLGLIAQGIGITLRGTLTRKALQLEDALRGTDYIVIIDEAEYLQNWQKLNELRKLQENAGIAMILLGTSGLQHVLERSDMMMLASRMTEEKMSGATKGEVRKALLDGYNIEPEAAAAMAEIAADIAYGGMRCLNRALQLCLISADGGRITMDMLEEAKTYLPGLRK